MLQSGTFRAEVQDTPPASADDRALPRSPALKCGPGVAGSRASPGTRWFPPWTTRLFRRKRARARGTLAQGKQGTGELPRPAALASARRGAAAAGARGAAVETRARPSGVPPPTPASASLPAPWHCAGERESEDAMGKQPLLSTRTRTLV